MNDTTTLTSSSIRIVYIEHPTKPNPLNVLSQPLRKTLLSTLQKHVSDPTTQAIILTSHSDHFSAGADINEFQTPPEDDTPTLTDLVSYISSQTRVPIIAALKGVALGGGLELALACDIRVAQGDIRLGLPEVNIGLIPGAYGTQRLPRLCGSSHLGFALDVMMTGRTVRAAEALTTHLVDGVCESGETVMDCAVRWARWALLMPSNTGWKLERRVVADNESLMAQWRQKVPPREKGGDAAHALLDAVEAGIAWGYRKGCATETELFWDLLLNSSQGRAYRHVFFAERHAGAGVKVPYDKKKAVVGVIGAGTMGTGIALSFLLKSAAKSVILVDVSAAALERGVGIMTKVLQSQVKKGRLSHVQMKALLTPPHLITSSSLDSLKPCNLVIEAVFENLRLKQDIASQLSTIVSPSTVLASNTSTLDISQIFQSVPHPQRCVGMHFFSPAHLMPLVEIVKAPAPLSQDQHSVGVIRSVTKSLNKVGVVVGVCDGFVGNRMVFPYQNESVHLLTEGAGVVQVDTALKEFGIKMGPFEMSDVAGNDIGVLIRKEKGHLRDETTGLPGKNRPPRYTELADDLVLKLKRTGQKAQKGWYNYDPQKGKGFLPLPSPEVETFIKSYQIQPQTTASSFTPHQIIERVLYPLVNEGFKILEEHIASDPCHIDIIYIYGYGWPAWRGGPMYWADNEVGLNVLLEVLQRLYRMYPGSEYFKPSELLKECVRLDVGVQEYYKKKMGREGNGKKSGDSEARSKL